MFPTSNKSSSVIDVLLKCCHEGNVKFELKREVSSVRKMDGDGMDDDGSFQVNFSDGSSELVDKLVIATGR